MDFMRCMNYIWEIGEFLQTKNALDNGTKRLNETGILMQL